MNELKRLPLVRTLLLGLVSLALVVASLGIEETAHNRSEAQDLGFGYPLHFAFSDFTTYYSPPAYPQTYHLNPWEIPMGGNPLTFLMSWVLTYAALLGCWVLMANTFRRAFRRVARAPRASTKGASVVDLQTALQDLRRTRWPERTGRKWVSRDRAVAKKVVAWYRESTGEQPLRK